MNSGDAGALARYQAARRAILAIIIVLAFTTLVFGGSLHDELTHEYIETLGLALVMVGIGGRLWATLYIGGKGYGQLVLGMIRHRLGDPRRAAVHLRAFLRRNASADPAKAITLREELRCARETLAAIESD